MQSLLLLLTLILFAAESNNNTKRRDSHDRENIDPSDRHWDFVEEVNDKNAVPAGGQHSYR